MAIKITDECINCGACEPECPNNAIYEGGAEWRFSDGTSLTGMINTPSGTNMDADDENEQAQPRPHRGPDIGPRDVAPRTAEAAT